MKLSNIKTVEGKYIAKILIPWIAYIYSSPTKEAKDVIRQSSYDILFKADKLFTDNVTNTNDVKNLGSELKSRKAIKIVPTVSSNETPIDLIAQALNVSKPMLTKGCKAIADVGDYMYPLGGLVGYEKYDKLYPMNGYVKNGKNTFPFIKVPKGSKQFQQFYMGWYSFDIDNVQDNISDIETMATSIIDNLDNLIETRKHSFIKAEIATLKELCELASPSYSYETGTIDIKNKDNDIFEASDGIINGLEHYQTVEKEILSSEFSKLLYGSIISVEDLRASNKETHRNLKRLVKDIVTEAKSLGETIETRNAYTFYPNVLRDLAKLAKAFPKSPLGDMIVAYNRESSEGFIVYSNILKSIILKNKGKVSYQQIRMGFSDLDVNLFIPEDIDKLTTETQIYTDGKVDYVKLNNQYEPLSRPTSFKHRIITVNNKFGIEEHKEGEYVFTRATIQSRNINTQPQYVYLSKGVSERSADRLIQADMVVTEIKPLLKKLKADLEGIDNYLSVSSIRKTDREGLLKAYENEKEYNTICKAVIGVIGIFLGVRLGSSQKADKDSALGPLTWRKENVQVKGKKVIISFNAKNRKKAKIELTDTTIKNMVHVLYSGDQNDEMLSKYLINKSYQFIKHLATDERPPEALLFQKAKGMHESLVSKVNIVTKYDTDKYVFTNTDISNYLNILAVKVGGFHVFRKVLGKIILMPIFDIIRADVRKGKPNNTFKTQKDLDTTIEHRLNTVSKVLQHTLHTDSEGTFSKTTIYYYIDFSDIQILYDETNFVVPAYMQSKANQEAMEAKDKRNTNGKSAIFRMNTRGA